MNKSLGFPFIAMMFMLAGGLLGAMTLYGSTPVAEDQVCYAERPCGEDENDRISCIADGEGCDALAGDDFVECTGYDENYEWRTVRYTCND